ncbi:hypothetical protein [Paracidovorax avenae]|uniref:hypothetical protein n=1 Tax=Paracidovorax avenae TaxID=80867 RepID=UPI0006B39F8F|nr:hypothetical protein [Paracidovorax avenae]
MTNETLLSLIALAFTVTFGVVTAVVSIAGLTDDGRARLRKWTKATASRAGRIFLVVFAVGILLNGFLGIALFASDKSPLTRKDILWLMVYISNVCIGLWEIRGLGERQAAKC